MVDCTFCGYEIAPTTGKQYIKKDGKVMMFCNAKCEKSQLKLKRVARNTPWTKTYRDLKKQKLSGSEKKKK